MNKVSEAVLREMYVKDGMPMHRIAEELGISIGTVYNYCHRYGIETKDQKTSFNYTGRKHSEETKKELSKKLSGKKRTNETKTKISIAKRKGGIGHKKHRADGYIAVYFPDHPCSNAAGYVMEHDLIMECLIGRHLFKNEIVHHINGVRADNRKENLKLMTASEHMSLHMKERHKKRKENNKA